MILTLEQIGRLHGNETIVHTEPYRLDPQGAPPWRPGHVFTIQRAVGRKASCRAELVHLERTADGRMWTLHLRITRLIRQPVRYLARGTGYTTSISPQYALVDAGAAIDEDEQYRISRTARDRDRERRIAKDAEQEVKRSIRRLRQRAILAVREGQDPQPVLEILDEQIEQLKRGEAA